MTREKQKRPYDYNVAILKSLGGKLKVSLMSACRRPGYEGADIVEETDNSILGQMEYIQKYAVKRSAGGDDFKKLSNNIARTRAKIQEYALCNDWEYFVTLTLDQNKYDRNDLEVFKKDFGRFIDLTNKIRGSKLAYLFIPEQHKDGAWHVHGLISGIKENELQALDKSYFDAFRNGRVPRCIMKRWKQGFDVWTWRKYSAKFGYATVDKIRDKNKISSYIRKYITKDLASTETSCNKHMYLASRGLKKSSTISKGHLTDADSLKTYAMNCESAYYVDGQYCKTFWFDDTDENRQAIGSCFEVFRFNDIEVASAKQLSEMFKKNKLDVALNIDWQKVSDWEVEEISNLFESCV